MLYATSPTPQSFPPADSLACSHKLGTSIVTHHRTDIEQLLAATLPCAIGEVTPRFEEAHYEYRVVAANSHSEHEWRGQMIAYANVVALLEDLKSRGPGLPSGPAGV